MGEMIGEVHNEVKFFHSESTEGSCQRHSVLSMNRRHYLLRISVEIAGEAQLLIYSGGYTGRLLVLSGIFSFPGIIEQRSMFMSC